MRQGRKVGKTLIKQTLSIIAASIFFNTALADNEKEQIHEYWEDKILLCSHDLLNAKLIIVNESEQEYRLAKLLLARASECETNGEVEFYSALLGVRRKEISYGSAEFINLLSKSAGQGNPFALAQLYRASTEDPISTNQKPDYYKDKFDQERSRRTDGGYPDLTRALEITRKMFDLPE